MCGVRARQPARRGGQPGGGFGAEARRRRAVSRPGARPMVHHTPLKRRGQAPRHAISAVTGAPRCARCAGCEAGGPRFPATNAATTSRKKKKKTDLFVGARAVEGRHRGVQQRHVQGLAKVQQPGGRVRADGDRGHGGVWPRRGGVSNRPKCCERVGQGATPTSVFCSPPRAGSRGCISLPPAALHAPRSCALHSIVLLLLCHHKPCPQLRRARACAHGDRDAQETSA